MINSTTFILSARNHFCGIFLNSQKYFHKMFLRCITDVTKKTSFLRYIWDVLKRSYEKYVFSEAVVKRCSVKKVLLEISQNSQENNCTRVSFLIKLQACNFIKKETLAQVSSCESCEVSKNTFLHRTPLVAASIFWDVFETS